MSEEQTMVQKAFSQIGERFDGIEKLLKRENSKSMMTINWNYGGTAQSYCSAPYSVRGKSNFSFGGWVFIDGLKTSPYFGWGSTGSWGGLSVGRYGTDKFYWRGGSRNAVAEAGTIISNEWMHLVITHQSSSMKCYVNGSLVTSLTAPSSIGTSVSERFKAIRGDYTDSDGISIGYTNCSIATLFCTQKVLTDSEIGLLASTKKPISKISVLYDNDLMFGYDVLDGISLETIPNVVNGGDAMTIYNGQYNQWSRIFE